MLKEKIQKARTIIEALPYIREFHGSTIVIKYGGSLIVEEEGQALFANDIVLLKYVGINPVIIHGGGKEISKWMQRVGKEAVFIDGLRVTDSETMEITEMVLSGKINNELVSLINQHGGKAVGLSGKDSHMFTARKIRSREDKDLGQVGVIESLDVSLIETLTTHGYIPVISSIGVSSDGQGLNLNADNAAAHVAASLKARKLIYLTDVNGVLRDEELIQFISLDEAREMLKQPFIRGGMIPKLEFSIKALEGGVESVHIINGSLEHSVLLEILTYAGIGTMIRRERPQLESKAE